MGLNSPEGQADPRDRPYFAHLTLKLEYSHASGDMSAYFAGLARGVAAATHCPKCKKAWFAPRLVCPRGHDGLAWIELPGTGVIRALTHTEGKLPFDTQSRHSAFALVAMDGADNLVFARIDSPDEARTGDLVRLVADAAARGGQAWCAVFLKRRPE